MDDGKVDLDPDLTSSIGDVLLSTKNDKTDANDSTPTSSTDAASSFSGASLNVSEDPISSTSSDVMDKDKLPGIKTEINKNDAEVSKNLLGTDGDVDLLDMNIANVSSEPINEDVEDIVQDLENLLGEPEPQHDYPRRRSKSPSKEKDLIASLEVPQEETSDSKILPETSNEESSEKDEIDHSIPLEDNIAQITKSEDNVPKCSTDKNEIETQETEEITHQEKIECVEEVKTEKTEDNSCKSEEIQLATSDDSKESEPIQNEATSEIIEATSEMIEASSEVVDATPEVEEINEVNTVSSSEVTVDKEDKPVESSNLPELILVSSNDVEEADVKQAEVDEVNDLLGHSEVTSEDQDINIPIETGDQETTHSNAAVSCDDSDSKTEGKPHLLPTEQVSKDQSIEVEPSSGDQLSVEESANPSDPPEKVLPTEELDNQDEATIAEKVLPTEELDKQDEATITEEVAEPMDSSETAQTVNIEPQQSSTVDPILVSYETSDSENESSEGLPISEETMNAKNEPGDIFKSTSTEAVIEPADHGSKVKDVPDETVASAVVTKVEVDPNVSSSSDLSNNEESDVKKPIILENNTIENLEDNNSTHSDELKEVIELKESVLVESEETEVSISEYENVEEVIPTEEICEGIVEEVESPMPEISSKDDAIEIDAVPSAEETIAITDITAAEDNSTENEDIADPIVLEEEISEEIVSSDNSSKSEDHSTKLKDKADSLSEEKSTTNLEETPTQQSNILDDTISAEESSETTNISSTNDNDDDSKHQSTLVSPETTSIEEKTKEENVSTKNEDVSTDIESKQDRLENSQEDNISSPLIENVLEEEICKREQPLTLNNVDIVDDVPSTNEDVNEILEENITHAENIVIVETKTEEDPSNVEAGIDENKSEVLEKIEDSTVEDIAGPIEEHHKIEEDPIEENIFQVEEEESPSVEAITQPTEELKKIEENPITEDIFQVKEESHSIEATGQEETIEQSGSPETEKQDIIMNDDVVRDEIPDIVNQSNVEDTKDNLDQGKIEEMSCIDTTPVANIETPEEEIKRESEEAGAELNIKEFPSQVEVSETIPMDKEQLELPEESGSPVMETLKFNIATEESSAATNEETMRAEIEENMESVKLPEEVIETMTDKIEENMESIELAEEVKVVQTMRDEIEENMESVELTEEDKVVENMAAEIEENMESVKLTEEDKVVETIRADIEENMESVELAAEDKVVDAFKSSQEELVPVNEEVCIKKVIIYEHKCESHKTTDNIISADEEKQEKSNTAARVEEAIDKEPEDNIPTEMDEIITEKDQCILEQSILEKQEQDVDEQKEVLAIPDVSVEENIEEIVEKPEENKVLIEPTLEQNEEQSVKEPIVLEVNTISNQREEVTSSSEHDSQVENTASDFAHPDDSKVVDQSSSEIFVKTSEEIPLEKTIEDTQVNDSNTEQIMEDQTTAAVQSILNNMLTEEVSIAKIIEKEDTPVVHSSYSSYEVQKAVQELQGITVEPVQISTEDIECIPSSEKTCESEKIEFENETCAVPNITSQSEVLVTQISESREFEGTQNIIIPETIPPEEIIDEKVECVQEIIDSPPNNPEYQVTMTHSCYEQSQDDNEDVQSTEEQTVLPSIEKTSTITSHIDEPVVVPSIDLSEESSSEEDSDHDKKQNVITSSVTSTSVIEESHSDTEEKESGMVAVKHLQKVEKSSGVLKNESKKHSSRETRHSSRISEKTKPHKEDINEPLSVTIDEIEREKPYSPKITIKPIKEDEPNEEREEHKGSLKITITKQSDNTHSILKMCSPEVDHRQKQPDNEEHNVVPKLVIKTSDTHSDPHSPKMSTRSCKQVLPNSNIRSGSPRITIKPILKPESKETITSPLKITIKPIGKPEEFSRQQQRHSPKQVKNKTDDDHYSTRSKMTKSSENSDVHSPKVTIKPVKPPEDTEVVSTPKITIKPIEKPEEARVSPKITIKPVLRPVELENEIEDEVKERIVLKINKGNLPTKDAERIGRESRKREFEEDKSEKLAKIKLKFSKDGDAHIVHKKGTEMQHNKRQQDFEIEKSKRFRAEVVTTDSDEDVKLIENTQSPIVISEDSQSQDSVILVEEARDPLADVATPEPIPQVTPVSAPKKRGRPRKVPLVVREEFGNEPREKIVQAPSASPVSVSSTIQPETETSGRPKRSCRAQSVRDTLGIKPRKPSKPRGGKRGGGAKSISMKPEKKKSKKYK